MATILVVDDDGQAIEASARLITQAGHVADFLLESGMLLDKLAASRPDLLLLDVNMPEIDGITLLKRIKAIPKLRDLPVIMITGETEESLVQECFQLGAVDFVNKPIRPLELISRIRIALETQAYIDALHARTHELQRAHSFITAILDSMEDAICVIDRRTLTMLEANRVFLEHMGHTREEVLGRRCMDLLARTSHSCLHCTGGNPEECILKETLETGNATCREVSCRGPSGESLHSKVYTFPIHDAEGLPERVVCLERDITKTRELEERLKHLAFHDPLTALPNRQLFDDRLRQALAQGRRHNRMVGVMLFDLDHFKTINDTHGHAAGDQLLKEVARRLGSCIRESDTVARLGGDEFTAVLTNVSDAEQVHKVARKILKALGRKVALDAAKIAITSSIGVSLYPVDGDGMEELLEKADQALYRAKNAGRNNVHFFSPVVVRK
ncbi:MAG: diguanylate cyclase [Magnetococcales bacterium]|nr:diguanylate cyclase [Magnetococcales bacterium]